MSENVSSSTAPSTPRVVVGVDGSEPSRDALRWAASQALKDGAVLHVVTCWSWPAMSGYAPPPVNLDLAGDAKKVQEDAIEAALGGFPADRLERSVLEGHPAAMVLQAAEGAELLVVGSRGHGAFADMLLGSVSNHCVSHASCPVVVVREKH